MNSINRQLNAVYNSCCSFFQAGVARAHSISLALAERMLGTAVTGTQEDQEPQAPQLAVRTVRSLTQKAAQSVPDIHAVQRTLEDIGFRHALPLGLALNLDPGVLLKQIGRHDPRRRVYQLLKAAPLQRVEDLANRLATGPLKEPEIAEQLRTLAHKAGTQEIGPSSGHPDATDMTFCNAVVDLLAGLADRSDLLGEALCLEPRTVAKLQRRYRPPEAFEDIERVCRAESWMPVFHQAPALTCRQWLEAIAQSGADAATLEAFALRWNMALPTPFTSWSDYRMSWRDLQDTCARLQKQYRYDPGQSASLSDIEVLIRHYASFPDTPEAMNPADTRCRTPEGRYQVLLTGLLADAHCGKVRWKEVLRLVAFCQTHPERPDTPMTGQPAP